MDKKWFIQIWKEGKYLDLWSVNHTLAGCVLGSIFIFINLQIWVSLIISVILMIGWEIFEIYYGIKEGLANKILDVVTGLVGFFLTYYLVNVQGVNALSYFLIIALSFAFLETWGYLVYKKIE
ncbi:MAG: hypothetical protein ACP5N2_01785 [Candidatus Nanoarchaeia archaeon]